VVYFPENKLMAIKSGLAAIILAGGKSSRMGEDKASIPIQGVPMLQRVYQAAASVVDKVYVVTSKHQHYQHLLPNSCHFIQEMPLSQEGPLVGFAQALMEVQTDWVLLLACDLPWLRVEVLQEWVAGLDRVDDEAIAYLAQHSKGWEPLCGFYRRRCLPELMEYVNQGGRSFQSWLKQQRVEVLALSEPEMLFNCNTKEDLDFLP
jgi:molybdenum cofactor guanylyltransferase